MRFFLLILPVVIILISILLTLRAMLKIADKRAREEHEEFFEDRESL